MATSPLARAFTDTMEKLDRKVGWHRVPLALGLMVLLGLRMRLQEKNLFDTDDPAGSGNGNGAVPKWNPRYATARTVDGTYNDLDDPLMGSAGSRFGRNVPLEYTFPETPPKLLEPNPRTVSRELLTRDEFQPATTLNVLAAAWIQFKVHDWFSHGKRRPRSSRGRSPLGDDDPWPEHPMRIQRTRARPDAERDGGPPTYVNTETHWWDGSQIYGSDAEFADALRTGERGKLRIGRARPAAARARAARRPDRASPGTGGSAWRCCTRCSCASTTRSATACTREYPDWSDDELFDKARLVNAALMAKIHTRRVDAGDHRAPDHGARACARTGGASPASSSTSASAGSATNEVDQRASRARRRTTTACPTR